MTLRTKTLTAVAALTICASGFALAQDASTTATPTDAGQPAEAQTAPEASESGAEAPDTAATEAPATETDAEAPTEAEEVEADAAETEDAEVADEPASETAEPDTVEAVEAEDVVEAEVEADTTEDSAAEDPAAESDTEEFVEEQPQPEPTDEAVAESSSEAEAPDGTEAETAVEEESAEEPTVSEEPVVEAEEHAAEAEAEAHAVEGEDHGGDAGDHGGGHIEDIAFSFEGPFGKYDQFQLQRGLQVYTEVCSSCHGMKFVPIRTLSDDGGPGLPEDQVRAYAAGFDIYDAEIDEDRPRLPTDHFPTVTGEGMGPDLSLMAKARAGFHGPYGTGISQFFRGIGGPEYVHAILTGYTGDDIEQAGTVLYENTAFPGGYISMPAPLFEDLVTYEDGTPATVDQMARDVSAFMMWTAEPKMMDRKMVGLVSVLFLIVLTALLYLTNKRIWAPHKGKVDPNAG